MPIHAPVLPRVHPPASSSYHLKARLYVQLFSWFALFIAVLHLFEGRSLGVIQFIVALIGIYASWDDVLNRQPFVTAYMLCCFVWATIDILFTLALLVAINPPLRQAAVSFLSSNTFPNLSSSLSSLLDSLSKDAQFFSVFSALVSVFFDTMAAYWAFTLHTDVLHINSSSETRQPLLPTTPQRVRVAGFDTLSRPANSQQQSAPRTVHPFAGRGYRLGFADSSASSS